MKDPALPTIPASTLEDWRKTFAYGIRMGWLRYPASAIIDKELSRDLRPKVVTFKGAQE